MKNHSLNAALAAKERIDLAFFYQNVLEKSLNAALAAKERINYKKQKKLMSIGSLNAALAAKERICVAFCGLPLKLESQCRSRSKGKNLEKLFSNLSFFFGVSMPLSQQRKESQTPIVQ